MEITPIYRVMFFNIFVTQHNDLVYQIIFKSGEHSNTAAVL